MIAPILHGDEGARVPGRHGALRAGTFHARASVLRAFATRPSTSGIAASWSRSISAAQTGHQQARAGPRAARLANGLACLANRLGSHRAGIDHHHVAGRRQQRANGFALGDVEPATERNDLRRHA
jgi:hypothetical protein